MELLNGEKTYNNRRERERRLEMMNILKSMLKRIALKLTSIKTILALWCCFIVTFITVNNAVELNNIAYGCLGLIAVYTGVNVVQKKKLEGDEN